MSMESIFIIFVACVFLSIITGFLAYLCSCYYPTLLTAKFYYEVKNHRLQNFLISPQRNRDASSKTATIDRNKLPLIGCICWLTNFLCTISTLSILLCLSVMKIFLPNAEVSMLADIVEPLFMAVLNFKYYAFLALMPVLYQLDYSIGKYLFTRKNHRD